jgi:hypothetical protein
MVEQALRTAKSLFETRPIFRKLDGTIRGHVSCSFLALVLKKALEDRITDFGKPDSWPEMLADIEPLIETELEQDGERFHAALRALLQASCCAPWACFSERNVTVCVHGGIASVSIPQRGGTKTPQRRDHERLAAFKQGQRSRAGVEGRISVLMRGRG